LSEEPETRWHGGTLGLLCAGGGACLRATPERVLGTHVCSPQVVSYVTVVSSSVTCVPRSVGIRAQTDPTPLAQARLSCTLPKPTAQENYSTTSCGVIPSVPPSRRLARCSPRPRRNSTTAPRLPMPPRWQVIERSKCPARSPVLVEVGVLLRGLAVGLQDAR